jgi:two-component system cell cycle response regulator
MSDPTRKRRTRSAATLPAAPRAARAAATVPVGPPAARAAATVPVASPAAHAAATAPAAPREARSGTRPTAPTTRSVDGLLLDYLNKPTTPGMRAVTIAALRHEDIPGRTSAIPTTPPDDPTQGLSPTALPAPVPTYEDDRPTGRWEVPYESNPKDLVRDRGVLVRLDGETGGEVLSLPRDAVHIGRSTRAHVLISDPSVSREHARIVYQYGAFYIEDTGSQNGTLLAGRRVTRAELRDGDLLQFGQRATFRFGLMDQTQERVMQRLFDSSMKDPLTGADNRRHLDGRLVAEIAFAKRHSRPLSVVLLDIDFFKAINDRYGHPAGDEVLKFISEIVRGQLRTEDALARYGGEEFVIVLRDTALTEATHVAERVRERIARTPIPLQGPSVTVTVSAGCASLDCCTGASTEELIGIADRRLYRAKRTGRNRVVSIEEDS